MRLFGDSEIALRSLSALFYLSGAGAAAVLGKRLSGEMRCGWYSGFFYILSPLAVRNAQNIRMYTLLGLLAGLDAGTFEAREKATRAPSGENVMFESTSRETILGVPPSSGAR